MSFLSDYKKIFQQGIESYGFRLMKGTNIFGKLINNEILLYILFDKRSALQRGNKAFTIISGVQTIYSYELSTHHLQLAGLELINYAQPRCDYIPNINFEYNEDNVSEILNKALEQTLSFVIPELLNVKDLRSCVEFLGKHRIDMLYYSDKFYRDSVLLIMTEDHSDFKDTLRTAELSMLRAFNNNADDPYYHASIKKLRMKIEEDLINTRDRTLNNPILREEALKEAQHRIENNRILLKNYGLL